MLVLLTSPTSVWTRHPHFASQGVPHPRSSSSTRFRRMKIPRPCDDAVGFTIHSCSPLGRNDETMSGEIMVLVDLQPFSGYSAHSSVYFRIWENIICLVVGPPLWKRLEFVNWDDDINPIFLKFKKWQPNHQPVMVLVDLWRLPRLGCFFRNFHGVFPPWVEHWLIGVTWSYIRNHIWCPKHKDFPAKKMPPSKREFQKDPCNMM